MPLFRSCIFVPAMYDANLLRTAFGKRLKSGISLIFPVLSPMTISQLEANFNKSGNRLTGYVPSASIMPIKSYFAFQVFKFF